MNRPQQLALGVLSLALGLSPCLPCHGALVDYFLKLEHIEGESQDAAYVGYCRILSFSWGMTKSGGITQSKGLTITKEIDKASPKLMEACAGGKHLPRVELIGRRTEGENQVEFLRIVMTDVLVSSVNFSFRKIETPAVQFDGSPSTGDKGIEEVSFTFSIIETFYQETDSGGAPIGDVVEGMVWLPLMP